jgi:hypothetical protein
MPRAKPEPDLETVELTRELIRARLETQNLHNLEKAGTLIERQAAELAISDIIARAKMHFQALPARFKSHLDGIVPPDVATRLQQELRNEVIRIFNEVAHAERLETERLRKIEKRLAKRRAGAATPPTTGNGRGGRPVGRAGVRRY